MSKHLINIQTSILQFGWIVSWAYLRFFKINEGGVRGDRSETFSLVSWFPPFMHRPVTFISNTLYGIFVKVGVIEPWHYSALGDVELGVGSGLPSMNVAISGLTPGGTATGGGGGGTRAEAERRRAMALKALDQRVKAGTQSGHSTVAGNGQTNLSGSKSNGNLSSPTSSIIQPPPPTAATLSPKNQSAVKIGNDSINTNGKIGSLPAVVVQQSTPSEGEENGGDLGASAGSSR